MNDYIYFEDSWNIFEERANAANPSQDPAEGSR